jgi:hypothetical protein
MHALPHMPQLSMSLCVSTHAPVHSTFGIGHTIEHDPFVHFHWPPPMIMPASPPPHAWPHLPQFMSSVFGSTHDIPHLS